MVLGDLNDEVEAATTQILNGPTGSEIGTGGFNQPDHGDRQRLWNLASRIPEANASAASIGGTSEGGTDRTYSRHQGVGPSR
jgi:hypothetical protein